jgi:hypothetical protein
MEASENRLTMDEPSLERKRHRDFGSSKMTAI